MDYRILCIGKIRETFYKDAIDIACRQVEKSGSRLEIIEFPDQRIPDRLKEDSREAFLEKECARLTAKITRRDYVVALCIEGRELSTGQHRECVKRAMDSGYERITYLIGGSLGLAEQVKKRADLKLSFSKMTFPHQMMRMILCEEIANLCKN